MSGEAEFRVEPDKLFAERTVVFPAFSFPATSLSAAWSGAAGGRFLPDGWQPALDVPSAKFVVFQAEDMFYLPALGLIVTHDGVVSGASYIEAKYVDPELRALKAAWGGRESASRLPEASVTMPWGGIANYGHFLLDGLVSVPFLPAPIVTPPLAPWQRAHFATLGVEPRELPEAIYRIGRATYTSALAHNLHKPNRQYATLRDLQRRSATVGHRRIYVSRAGQKRPFLSEAPLTEALRPLGFEAVQPERLTVPEQMALFAEAEIIVAPTGAALANCLYCPPGAKIIELIPRDMIPNERAYRWTGYVVAFAGGDWRPFFCENVADLTEAPEIGGRKRAGFLPFDADLGEIIAFTRMAIADGT